MILLTKNQIHAFDKVNRPAGTMLLFTSDFLDSISANVRLPANVLNFNSYEKSPVYAPSPQLTSYCELVINELRQIESGAVLNELSLRLLFATLLIKLSTGNGMPGDASTNDVDRKHVNRFMALIEQDYSTAKDASVYAEFMGITYKTLNRICRQIVGMSPKQIIDAQTILEAKRRLVIEKTKVTELAYQLGFEDSSNFVKYFKKHTTVTPHQFRKNH